MSGVAAIAIKISPEFISAGPFSGAFLSNEKLLYATLRDTNKLRWTSNLLPLRLNTRPSMISGIYKKRYIRLLLFLLISFPLKLMLDLIFGLLYRNYSIIRPAIEYFGAAILTIIALETVYILKRGISKRFAWDKNPLRRLFLEIGINVPLLLIIILAISFAINFYILQTQFIQLSDEAVKLIYYLLLLVIAPAFIEFAVFLLNRWRTSLAEMEKYKKENAEYRFETLRTQVNPHFLFNSLNTLSSLVYEDREKAAGFIRDLSDVYRYVLENRSRETIVLKEEIRFIKSFVYLYQLRFDNKLNVEINIADTLLEKLVAPMTLQLLVENAVKHNIVSTLKPLSISITTDVNDYLIVENNLQKKTGVVSSEIGLKNISSRYAFLTRKPVEVIETESEFIVKVPLL
jgi:sensor histidine kinase YesM